jgi:hypothetical protein
MGCASSSMSESNDSNSHSTVIHCNAKEKRPHHHVVECTAYSLGEETSNQDHWEHSPSSPLSHNQYRQSREQTDTRHSSTSQNTTTATTTTTSAQKTDVSKLYSLPHKASCPCYVCLTLQKNQSKYGPIAAPSTSIASSSSTTNSKLNIHYKTHKAKTHDKSDKYETCAVEQHCQQQQQQQQQPQADSHVHASQYLDEFTPRQKQPHSPNSISLARSHSSTTPLSSPPSASIQQTRFRPKIVLFHDEDDKGKQYQVDDVFQAQLSVFKSQYRSGSVSFNNGLSQFTIATITQ